VLDDFDVQDLDAAAGGVVSAKALLPAG